MIAKSNISIKFIIAILCFSFTNIFTVNGQANSDKQLALQYYQNQEYEKAATLYEQLFSKSNLDYYYLYYFNCLIQLEDYNKAEKLCKKQVKKNPEKLKYIVDLGYLYKISDNLDKSIQHYNKAIKILGPDRHQTNILANSFIGRGEEEMAIKVYQKGKKTTKDNYKFHFELAHIYKRMGKTNLMVDEYLDHLGSYPTQKNQIQNLLQLNLYNEINKTELLQLKENLFKRIQKYPELLVFSEMLIWFYIQEKDFGEALIQAQAIDKRKNENGHRIMKLGKLCLESKVFDIAITCFQYVVDKKSDSNFYVEARMALLDAYNKKITSSDYTKQDLIELETNYTSSLEDLGKSGMTLSLIRGLAHLKAFYLSNATGAVDLLKEAIKLTDLKPKDKAYCKLELADILLLTGMVWDASLYYSQIEKVYPNDPIGHEAKFRNAQLFYFKGEFEWAQTQLDVLKASTSKLIANDAMNLALLITDNTIFDSTHSPLMIYANAELFSYQNKFDSSMTLLKIIEDSFPGHSLIDEVYYKKAEIMISKRNYIAAAEYLSLIVSNYSYDILADDALFKLAEIYETKLNNKEKAMELYKNMLVSFPGSMFVVESRKRYRKLRGDEIN